MSYLLLSQPLHTSQSCSSGFSNLEEKERACLSASHIAGETGCSFTCSNFSLWEESQSRRAHGKELCHPGAGVMQVIQAVPLSMPMHPNSWVCFFLRWYAGTSLLESRTSIRALVSVNDCLRQCSPGGSWPWLRGTGVVAWATSESTAETEVCVPLTQHTACEATFGYLHTLWGPRSSHKSTSVYKKMRNCWF